MDGLESLSDVLKGKTYTDGFLNMLTKITKEVQSFARKCSKRN